MQVPVVPDSPGRGRRFAIAASDPYLGVLNVFVEAGWVPMALHVVPEDGLTVGSQWIVKRAQQLGMDISLSRLDDRALEGLAARRCELLVVASHNWRVGRWEPWMPHAINFHPSLLPDYRGPFPQVHAILNGETRWGVSCHKISPEFDQGDLLSQRSFALDADETLERLTLRIRLAATSLAADVARDLDRLWAHARPQAQGSYVPKFTDADRLLDFTGPVAELDRRLRAFGPLECLADLRGMRVRVMGATCWREAHGYAAGTLVSAHDGVLIIAVADGYAGLTRWLPIVDDPANQIAP